MRVPLCPALLVVALGLLLAPAYAQSDAKIKLLPTNPEISVTYECVSRDANAMAATVEQLRALPGVQVTGSFAGVISLRLTPNQRSSVDVDTALQRYCSRIFRSHTNPKPQPTAGAGRAAGTPFVVDTKEAVKAMLLDTVLANNPKLDGSGIKIGILSDSFNVLKETSFPCQAVQELTVMKDKTGALQEGPAEFSRDEGRAMAELICNIAPKAQLYFWSAFNGPANFAEGIVALQQAGCQVIVDDVVWSTEPWYSPGIIAQAVDQVAAAGAAYFGAAANFAGLALEQVGRFQSTAALGMPSLPADAPAGDFHNWRTMGPDSPAWLKIVNAGDFLLVQWDEPFLTDTNGTAAAVSDLNLWLCAKVPTTTADYSNCLHSTIDSLDAAVGDPIDIVPADDFSTLMPGNYWLAVQRTSGSQPRQDLRFKVYNFGKFDVLPGQSVTSGASTVTPHVATPNGFAVGAAYFRQTPGYGQSPALIEPYSSWGATPMMYTATGKKLPAPKMVMKPDAVGVDGTATSFFGDVDEAGVHRFFGTSAAAPLVAALAALMIQQDPALTPDAVYAKLRATTQDMFVGNPQGKDQPTAGPDRYTGYGFVDASKALAQCSPGACCQDGMLVEDDTDCAWSGGDDSRFITGATSPAQLTYSTSDSAPATASLMSSGAKDCKGTCRAGMCTITPREAFCCFTDSSYYDASTAAASPAKRHSRKHGAHADKGTTFHCWN